MNKIDNAILHKAVSEYNDILLNKQQKKYYYL